MHQFSTSDTIIVLCNLNHPYSFLTPPSWCFASFEIGTNKGGCSGCGRGVDKGAFVPLGGVVGATGFFRTLVSGRKNGDVSPPSIPFPLSAWGMCSRKRRKDPNCFASSLFQSCACGN